MSSRILSSTEREEIASFLEDFGRLLESDSEEALIFYEENDSDRPVRDAIDNIILDAATQLRAESKLAHAGRFCGALLRYECHFPVDDATIDLGLALLQDYLAQSEEEADLSWVADLATSLLEYRGQFHSPKGQNREEAISAAASQIADRLQNNPDRETVKLGEALTREIESPGTCRLEGSALDDIIPQSWTPDRDLEEEDGDDEPCEPWRDRGPLFG